MAPAHRPSSLALTVRSAAATLAGDLGGNWSMTAAAGFLRARWVHVIFAFVAMGGWALFANRAHGAGALAPALVQGLVSAGITAILKGVLDRFAGRFPGLAAYVLPPLITASVVLAALVAIHLGIGTPELVRTIAAPWSVSTLYAILYAADLERRRR